MPLLSCEQINLEAQILSDFGRLHSKLDSGQQDEGQACIHIRKQGFEAGTNNKL